MLGAYQPTPSEIRGRLCSRCRIRFPSPPAVGKWWRTGRGNTNWRLARRSRPTPRCSSNSIHRNCKPVRSSRHLNNLENHGGRCTTRCRRHHTLKAVELGMHPRRQRTKSPTPLGNRRGLLRRPNCSTPYCRNLKHPNESLGNFAGSRRSPNTHCWRRPRMRNPMYRRNMRAYIRIPRHCKSHHRSSEFHAPDCTGSGEHGRSLHTAATLPMESTVRGGYGIEL